MLHAANANKNPSYANNGPCASLARACPRSARIVFLQLTATLQPAIVSIAEIRAGLVPLPQQLCTNFMYLLALTLLLVVWWCFYDGFHFHAATVRAKHRAYLSHCLIVVILSGMDTEHACFLSLSLLAIWILLLAHWMGLAWGRTSARQHVCSSTYRHGIIEA